MLGGGALLSQPRLLALGLVGAIGAAAVYGKGIALPTGLHYAANLCTSAFGISAALLAAGAPWAALADSHGSLAEQVNRRPPKSLRPARSISCA